MAFLRVRARGRARYFYIVENRRRGGKVQQKILEYLGRDPDPKRLAEAKRYWRVGRKRKAKPAKRGGSRP